MILGAPFNFVISLSPFIIDSIWHKPIDITNFTTLGIDPKSAKKVYYGNDATGRPPDMLENILDGKDMTEWHDLSSDISMIFQNEQCISIYNANWRNSF